MADKEFLDRADKYHLQFISEDATLAKYEAGTAVDELSWVYFEYSDASSFRYRGIGDETVPQMVNRLYSTFSQLTRR